MLEVIELTTVLVSLTGLCAYLYILHHSRLSIPPGPRPLPILGNYLSIPSRRPWETYAAWAREYNTDVVSVHTLGHLTLIVNTIEAAKEMFERRSAIYSDRPQFPMINMMEWDFNLGLMPYSDGWRMRRKMLHQFLHSGAAAQYRPLQKKCAVKLMKLLHTSPESFADHVEYFAGSIVMSLAYAHEVDQSEDRYVDIAERASKMLSGAMFPGAAMVNALPILKHLPKWFPGAGFKTYAEECASLVREMRYAPFDAVKRSMVDGTARPSMTASLLEMHHAKGGDEAETVAIMDVSAMTYASGTDATASALNFAILALILHPEVQRRVQAEIDNVVGRERLPDFGDPLPYVDAVCREASRWGVTGPLGVAHAASEHDVYRGWHIPKGTQIFFNSWAMLHDPVKYPDPESFKPERFFKDDGTLNDDDVQAAFGFGRRVCVGQHLARASIWIMVACTLALFDIEPAKGEAGHGIPIHVDCTDGLISRPLPFQCSIRPRDKKAEDLIKEL